MFQLLTTPFSFSRRRSLLWLLMMTTNVCWAAFPDYYFQQVSLREGLSQTTVTAVQKDYKGVVWIGTQMGLNRFDQYDLKSYLHDSQKSESLPANEIYMLQEDSLLNLWVGTSGGLALYNRGEDYFVVQTDRGKPIEAWSSCLVEGGVLFVGSGLWKYSYRDRSFRQLVNREQVDTIKDYLSYIEHWEGDRYLVGTTWRGCYLYNGSTHTLERFELCPQEHISAYFIDRDRNLWVALHGKGVVCYDSRGEEVVRYTTRNSGLSNDIVLDILFHRGELWMATDGGGIACLNPLTRQFKVIDNQSGNPNSFPVSSVKCLYQDRSGTMWAGTIRGGLLNIREVYMRTFQDVPFNGLYGLTNKTVLSLYEEGGYIYIGTDGGGVNRFDPSSNRFKHYPEGRRDKVVSITGYSDRELLISCFGKGLYFFDKQTGQSRPCDFIGLKTLDKVKAMGISINVHRYAPNQYHLLADSVYLYDMTTRHLRLASTNRIDSRQYTPMSALKVVHSTEQESYLAGVKNIFHLDNRTGQLSLCYTAPKDMIINDVCRGVEGRFWMATTRGLMEYNPVNGSLRKIQTLLFDEARVVAYDPVGRLWIGARGVLLAYTIEDRRFTLFGQSDGALLNEFLSTGSMVADRGDIYLGGASGLLRIDKEYQFKNRGELKMELMNIQLNGVTINHQLSDQSELTIPSHFTSFTIRFVANEEDVFRRKLYRYSIGGLSKEIESEVPVLTLYTLPPGSYPIKVSCSNRDGSWTSPTYVLTLHVPVPWWRSIYFILFVLLLLTLMGFYGVAMYNRKKRHALRWEMKEHQEQVNEEKVRFLINISHELCTPLMLVYAPLKRLLNKETLAEEIRDTVENACRHVKRMQNLIEMVLDVRRMEMGQNVLRYSTREFHLWLMEVVNTFKKEYESREMAFIFDFDESIGELTFDVDKCEIVVSNLLMNAFKFSPPQSVVRLTTERCEEVVRIAVVDQGVGLSESDQAHLFTRFYQGEHSKGGSGIGLSCAKTLIELQGGTIKAVNNPSGVGATFSFALPLRQDSDRMALPNNISINEVFRFTDRRERTQLEGKQVFDTGNYSILIVEDNAELSDFLREELKFHFDKVYTCSNGRDALVVVKQRTPDIIVSDIMMERGDGLELCRQLKEQEETSFIPIVLLTARADVESAASGYRLGADIYLTKPFDVDDLLAILRNLLKNRKQLQTLYRNSQPNKVLFSGKLSNADDLFVRKLGQVVSEYLPKGKVDSDFLADQMGMSRTSLYNRVRAVLNMSVSDYINGFRIEKAVQLLRDTDCSILEISELVGFANQGYFSTFFKKMIGCTPSKYREQSMEQMRNTENAKTTENSEKYRER